jgi:hypothetical protein
VRALAYTGRGLGEGRFHTKNYSAPADLPLSQAPAAINQRAAIYPSSASQLFGRGLDVNPTHLNLTDVNRRAIIDGVAEFYTTKVTDEKVNAINLSPIRC